MLIQNFYFLISPQQGLIVVSNYKHASNSDTLTDVNVGIYVM